MCHPYIAVLSDDMGPALSWTHKCEGRFEICCSVLVSVCVRHTHLSWEKLQLEVCVRGWNRTCQPYIENTSVHSD